MSFNKAFSAGFFALLTAVLLCVCGFADEIDSSAESAPSASGDLSQVSRSYNEESMMYVYTFSDGADFYASELLSETGNTAAALLVGSENADVSILVRGSEGVLEQSNEYFLTTEGSFEVYVSHGDAEVRFGVTIGEKAENPEEKMITGRVSLENIDGATFKHKFEDGSEFVTNVLDGETVNYIPKLVVPENAICSVTKDGSLFSMPASGLITEDGAYNIEISCVDGTGKIEKRYFSFSLFTKATNRLGIFQPPRGFELTSVKLNGEEIALSDKSCSVLDGEGDYSIEYTNGEVTKSVDFTRDTVPPVVYMNGTTNVVFTENVFLTANTECTFRVTKNGQIIGNVTELSGAGIYRISAADTAGNITSLRVEIKAVSAINPLDIIIIAAILIAAALGYFFFQKNRKMTVR